MKKSMKKIMIMVLVLIIIFIATILILYFRNENNISINDYIVNVQDNIVKNSENDMGEIKEIPREYYSKADKQGKLEEFYYDTYESKTYEQKSKKLSKRAIVYTPYGYDENKEYDIFYLMHGGWSNETTSLGTPNNPGQFKNVIDHAIENGEIKPIIIVCPTYNNESSEDSGDYTLAYYTLTVNYHNELINDLVPAVESKYSTYAKSTSHEDIVSSREHRAFGGFSMGSVTTWHTFVNNLDSFKYFITSSGAIDSSLIDNSVQKQGYTSKDFFMMSFTGTEDFAGSGFTSLINDLLDKSSKNFIAGTNEQNGNLYFRVKTGYSHDGGACMTYMYNGLLGFWNTNSSQNKISNASFDLKSTVEQVKKDESFTGFGELIFPVDVNIPNNTTLEKVGDYYAWYNYINPNKTVEIVNYMKEQVNQENKIFYDIYTDEEKAVDPSKENTGLFFFKGNPNEKVAIVSAGGGFSYVGAMHDSFPHCLELSKKGYNAFAIIYRPDAQKACEDLSRAIAFINEHKEELQVNMENYSLWGGSAGGRMTDWVGTYGTSYFGEKEYPKPSALIIQYTGLSEVTGNEPPTYSCVGTADGIASYRTMKSRIEKIKANGIKAEIEIFNGLPHGFGLGEGTVAEGWINNAIDFWKSQM